MTMNTASPAGDLYPAVRELQGLNIELLAGASANTKIDVAAIRPGDTLKKALNNNAGTITDVTADGSIVDCRASGTITVGTVVNTNNVVVQGVTYTFKTTPGVLSTDLAILGTPTLNAAQLRDRINAVENGPKGQHRFSASANGAVVTVRARVEGTAGNAYTTTSSANLTCAAGTLTGGTATGGVKFTGATNQVILFWFNKG